MKKEYTMLIFFALTALVSGCQTKVLSHAQLKSRLEGYSGFWRYIGTTNGYHFVEQHIPMSVRNYYRIPEKQLHFPRTTPISKDERKWEPLFCSSGIVRVAESLDRVPYHITKTNSDALVRIEFFATGIKKAVKRYKRSPGGEWQPHGKWKEWNVSGQLKSKEHFGTDTKDTGSKDERGARVRVPGKGQQ
jgi:hypothetical protein